MAERTAASGTTRPARAESVAWGDHEAWLARAPWIGAVLVAVGLTIFAVMLYVARSDGFFAQVDKGLSAALHGRATQDPVWLVLLWRGLAVPGQEIVGIGMVLLAIHWIRHHRWREVTMLLVGPGLELPIFTLLTTVINRHRPEWPTYIEFLPGPGFPSGHLMAATLFYGLIAYLLLPHLKSRAWRILAFVDVAVLLAVVGLSRIYVGLHYPSDVLAGIAIGMAWGGLVYTGVEVNHWLRPRKGKQARP